MDSSDEDFLPDPEERFRGKERMRKKPPDRATNKQSGLDLHDDVNKGKCFLFLSVVKE